MGKILCIETATPVCSVCLSVQGNVLAYRESSGDRDHAARLTVFLEEVLAESGLSTRDLDLVAVSMGPGSYTGLRIGVSVAKGIAYGASLPLAGIPSLQSLAAGIMDDPEVKQYPEEFECQNLFIPMIDARRMEVYTAVFNSRNEQIRETHALVVDKGSFRDYPERHRMFFFGDGAEKCSSLLEGPGVIFPANFQASARNMVSLAEQALARKQFVDLAYFEPFYLKDFIPTVPRKNILHRPDNQ